MFQTLKFWFTVCLILLIPVSGYAWTGTTQAGAIVGNPSVPPVVELHQNNITDTATFQAYGACSVSVDTSKGGAVPGDNVALKIQFNSGSVLSGVELDFLVETSGGSDFVIWVWFPSSLSAKSGQIRVYLDLILTDNSVISIKKSSCQNASGRWIPFYFNSPTAKSVSKLRIWTNLPSPSDGTDAWWIDKAIAFIIEPEGFVAETPERLLIIPGGWYGKVFNDLNAVDYYEVYLTDALGHGRRLLKRAEDWNSHDEINLLKDVLLDYTQVGYREHLGLVLKAVDINGSAYESINLYKTIRRDYND